MAKKKTKHTSTSPSTTKRAPPSIPKTVKKDSGLAGYITDFVSFNNEKIRFLLSKTDDGYITFKMPQNGTRWIDMRSESLSPTTRIHFVAQSTLTKAIANIEAYLQFKLPEMH